jgi:putative MATE family efflux protein
MALAIAVPIMLQNGITNFVSLLDNIMVGRVGTEQMTGVSIVNQLIFVLNLAIFGAVSGAGIYGAQFFGSGNTQGVRHTFRFKLLICAGMVVAGAGIFLLFGEELILLYLRGEGDGAQIAASLGYAKSYLAVMLIGFFPFALSQAYASTLRETGKTVQPMVAGIISVGVNLCLNALLIFGYLGFPRLGALGAAIATVVARFAEAAILIVWTHKNAEKNPFIVGALRSLRVPKRLTADLAKKSVPLMLNETLWAGGMALLAQCYSLRGYNVVSANSIASTVSNVFMVAFLAMGMAIGIIVGQQLGAGELEKAADTDRKLIVFSLLLSVAVGGLMAAVSPLFPRFYNVPGEIRGLATSFLLVIALCSPINSLSNAAYFTMRSGGKTFITFLFDSFYVCCVTVPLAYALSYFTNMPIVPLFLICQVIDIGKCIIGVILIKKGVWIQNIVGKGAQGGQEIL